MENIDRALSTIARLRQSVTSPNVAVECFSGSGRWSSALRRLGWIVIELDIAHGCDLLNRGTLMKLRGAMAAGYIDAIHFGTPCSSFSSARGLPNGPPALRSHLFPDGLPNLSENDQKKVILGNACARATASLALTALRFRIPGSIENHVLQSYGFLLPYHVCFVSPPSDRQL